MRKIIFKKQMFKPLVSLSALIILTAGLYACGGGASDDDANLTGDGNPIVPGDGNPVVQCSFSNNVIDPTGNDNLANNGNGTSFTQHAALIANTADIIYAGYGALVTSTAALKAKVDDYCANATNIANASKRTTAQSAFKTAMNDLQYSLVHSAKNQGLYPALDVEEGIETIYSWPLTSTCSIDKQLAVNNPVPGSLLNRRGLDSVEYLLFISADANSSCDVNKLSDFEKNKYTEFNALTSEQKQLRRCGYMKNIVADVASVASVIKNKWDPADADYLGTMKASTSPTVTLNNVTDAMYYLADVVKEDKLAQPMGTGRANTTPSCGEGNACPQDVESPNAKISLDNLIANTQSFQKLYFGGNVADKNTNVGFDDWLITKGEVAVANKISSDIAEVLTGLNSIKTNHGTLYSAVTTCETELETFFDTKFQSLTRGFRDNLLPRLGLQPPQSSTADAD